MVFFFFLLSSRLWMDNHFILLIYKNFNTIFVNVKTKTFTIHSFVHLFILPFIPQILPALNFIFCHMPKASRSNSLLSLSHFVLYSVLLTSSYFFCSKQYFLSITSLIRYCLHFFVFLCTKTLLHEFSSGMIISYPALICPCKSDFARSLHSHCLWWNHQ